MASNKTKVAETVTEPVAETPVAKTTPQSPTQESVYTAAELADNYKLFGTFREIVVIALRKAGKETATVSEAKSIIQKFKSKEVK